MKEKLHIIPHNHQIDQQLRNSLNGHLSATLWFAGLSGSGKSTLANQVEKELHARGIRTALLDGDNIRVGLNKDLDFSDSGRVENIRRIAEVAHLMNQAGLVVLTAFISPFKIDREQARSIIGNETFHEVYVDCPLEICEQRDVKGLYQKARNGEITKFTGIDSPFESPEKPEIIVETGKHDLAYCTTQILNYILPRLGINEQLFS